MRLLATVIIHSCDQGDGPCDGVFCSSCREQICTVEAHLLTPDDVTRCFREDYLTGELVHRHCHTTCSSAACHEDDIWSELCQDR